MDSALDVNAIPVHCRPDSERLLRTHNAWQASWDQSDKPEIPSYARKCAKRVIESEDPETDNWFLKK